MERLKGIGVSSGTAVGPALVAIQRTQVIRFPIAPDRVEVITGVNLPMLIKLVDLPEQADLLTAAREMREQGRAAIWVASDLLRGEKAGEKA